MACIEELLNPEMYQRGYQDGVVQGLREGQRAFLLSLLACRFGDLPESVTQRVDGASIEELERWSERTLDAATLDDVFAAP